MVGTKSIVAALALIPAAAAAQNGGSFVDAAASTVPGAREGPCPQRLADFLDISRRGSGEK